MRVYKFVQRIEPTVVGTRKVPGELVGKPDEATVRARQYYRNYKTYYIEPRTGTPVQVVQDRRTTLRAPDGSGELVAIDAQIVLTDKQVNELLRTAGNQGLKLTMLRTGVPLIFLALGLALLAVGVVLFLVLGRRREPARTPTADVRKQAWEL